MTGRSLLYYITDRKAFPGDEPRRSRALLEKIAEAARAGVDFVQLREKDLCTRDLECLAREAVSLIIENAKLRTKDRELRTALLVNSRTDVALAVQAHGVQLRSEDIFPQDVRAAWGRYGASTSVCENSIRNPIIAVSCHSSADVIQAEVNAANFAVFAPIFEKKEQPAIPPAGLAQLQEACRGKIPVLALGGITLQNAQRCLEAGAAGIAAVRLFQENDIAAIIKQLRGNS